MCYGAYCSDHGDGTVGVSLIYDDPSDDVENARRNEACGNVACTAEETCDEYPFASTSDADIEDRYARCVPAVPFNENSSRSTFHLHAIATSPLIPNLQPSVTY